MTGLTLDAGALIAFEHNRRGVTERLKRAQERGHPVFVPAGVEGQVRRDGRRQARLSALLGSEPVRVMPVTDIVARWAGRLCGATGTSNAIDATVVVCARTQQTPILTSDPHDLRRLDPPVRLIAV